jgi:alkylated DNA repair dioxygenase AlkB
MFKDDLYEVVRGVLSKELCTHLDTEFELLRQLTYLQGKQSEENKFMFGDSQVTNSFAYYSALCFESLALQMQPLMEKITGKSLYPTYTYARIYYNEATMAIHKDRPSCEFSATVNITIDEKPWEIWFESLQGEHKAIELYPGDLIVYKGDTLKHWRDAYKGQRQTQAFLHYVDKKGKYRDYKFDKRSHLGLSSDKRSNS